MKAFIVEEIFPPNSNGERLIIKFDPPIEGETSFGLAVYVPQEGGLEGMLLYPCDHDGEINGKAISFVNCNSLSLLVEFVGYELV